MDPSLPETAGHAPRRTDAVPLQSVLARVERLADDFSSACKPLTELAKKLTGEPVVERSPLVSLSALLHPAYEPGDGSADGAQMVEMAWWHPVMGCDSLQIVVDNARAALAQPEPEVGPTDEELLELARAELNNSPNWEEPEYDASNPFPYEAPGVAWLNFARAVLARWGRPAPAPAEGEVAELVSDHAAFAAWLAREMPPGTIIGNPYWWAPRIARRAANLLEQRHPAPVPVAERLPGPGDCDAEGRCWAWRHFDPYNDDDGDFWQLIPVKWLPVSGGWTHWLPATALPLPQGEVE